MAGETGTTNHLCWTGSTSALAASNTPKSWSHGGSMSAGVSAGAWFRGTRFTHIPRGSGLSWCRLAQPLSRAEASAVASGRGWSRKWCRTKANGASGRSTARQTW